MSGFDMQLTAPGTLDYFAAELRAFLRTLGGTRKEAEKLGEQVQAHFGRLNRYVEALTARAAELGRAGVTGAAQGAAIQAWQKVEGDALRPVAGDLNGLLESTAALERLLQQGDRTRTQVLEREGFMLRAIESLAGYGANLLEMYGKHSPETTDSEAVTGENRRDQVNAENLRWLIDTACADRRIMVWAHNARDERVVREGVRQYRPGASERRDEADRRVARRLVWRGPL